MLLHQDALKFVLNAAVDTLPHNANLYPWEKKDSDRCPLCSADSSEDIANRRHDAVLQLIAEVVKEDHDLMRSTHIANTDLWSDILLW